MKILNNISRRIVGDRLFIEQPSTGLTIEFPKAPPYYDFESSPVVERLNFYKYGERIVSTKNPPLKISCELLLEQRFLLQLIGVVESPYDMVQKFKSLLNTNDKFKIYIENIPLQSTDFLITSFNLVSKGIDYSLSISFEEVKPLG